MKRTIFLALAFLLTTACSASVAPFQSKNYYVKSVESQTPGDLVIRVPAFDSPGDCTLVSLNNADLLIDCGGSNSKAEDKVYSFLKENVKDNVLEYMIVTHPDKDHVRSFVSSERSGMTRGLLEGGKIGTLIDYDSSKDTTVTETLFKGLRSNQAAYMELGQHEKYSSLRNTRISTGKIGNYYTASQCLHKKRKLSKDQLAIVQQDICKNNLPISEAFKNKKKLVLSDSFPFGNDNFHAELKILNNVMTYKNNMDLEKEKSAIVNCLSVCSLITYKEDKFLFTGDLEEFKTQGTSLNRIKGETMLIDNNKEELKDGVLFFRGGHHGAKSSSSAYFTSVIRPQYVCWTGVAGVSGKASPYKHPSQNAINNVGRYTDKIYYSSCTGNYFGGNDTDVVNLYGDTTFTYSPDKGVGEKMKVTYEEEGKVPDSFFLSQYFTNPRIGFDKRNVPVCVYNLTADNVLSENPVECSYVKIGHMDILIGCGIKNINANPSFKKQVIEKIKYLCNDKVLEYVIVPSNRCQSYSFLVGEDGLLNCRDIRFKYLFMPKVDEAIKGLSDTAVFEESIIIDDQHTTQIHLADDDIDSDIFIEMKKIVSGDGNGKDISLRTVVNAFGFNYLHLGSNISYSSNDITPYEGRIDAIQIPFFGQLGTDSSKDFYSYISKISTKESNHAYHNYASNKEKTESLDGMVALFNTSFDFSGKSELPSSLIFKRNNQSEQNGQMLKYGENKHLLAFPTLFTSKDSKICEPFNKIFEVEKGDLCLMASCVKEKIRMAVAPNYSRNSLWPLMFNDVSGNGTVEQDSRSNAIMIDGKERLSEIIGQLENYQSK